jgi:hypothetical protein
MSANQPMASGPGLSHGRTGAVCKFHVKMPTIADESKGKLSMGISGPSKVVLESQHTSDGFDVSYTPLEEGDYQLTIKCDGKHIPGSPFSIAVEKNPEFVPPSYPAKCKASGPGLKKGVALKPCYFSVDTSNAGRYFFATSLPYLRCYRLKDTVLLPPLCMYVCPGCERIDSERGGRE